MNTTTISLEQLKDQYYKANRSFERHQNKLAKELGWSTFYEIRPVDLTPEDLEKISAEEVEKLAELYTAKRELYWSIHEREAALCGNMKYHNACKKAYDFIDGFPVLEANNILKEHGLSTFGLIAELEENPNFLEEVIL